MNCKQGDMAIVVGCLLPFNGKIVTCVRIVTNPFNGAPGWNVDPPLHKNFDCIEDRFLRPIRDPGDDAVDEMVQLLGKPQEVTA